MWVCDSFECEKLARLMVQLYGWENLISCVSGHNKMHDIRARQKSEHALSLFCQKTFQQNGAFDSLARRIDKALIAKTPYQRY